MSFHPLVHMQQKWRSEGLLAERNRDIEDKESLEEGLFLLVGWGTTTVAKWQQKDTVGCYDNESTCLGLIFIFDQKINNSLDDTSLTGYLFSLYSCSIKKMDLQKQWCRDYFHTSIALWQNAQWNTIIFFFLYCFDLCYCLISIIMMVPEAMPFSTICLMSWCACINFWQPLNLEQYDSIRKMASEIHAYAPDARVLTTYYCGMNSLPSVLITHFFGFHVSCLFLSSVLSSQLFLYDSGDFHDLMAFCFQ